MKTTILDHLRRLADQGEEAKNRAEYDRWGRKTAEFLRVAFDEQKADSFVKLATYSDPETRQAVRLGHLQGLIAREAAEEGVAGKTGSDSTSESDWVGGSAPTRTKRVFVVHGHDNEAKEYAARFIERLGLEAIVLHEQPSAGRTVIEKFEIYAKDIAFAIVLLTPDDVGGVAKTPSDLRPRARQNVVMELGYFIGRLGRFRVCALHKGDVELPSDYQGVIYIDMDESGAWKMKLAQELVQAKLPIDLGGLV